MNPLKFPPLRAPLKFYAVVPDAAWVERMVKAGADTVQLRNKTLSGEALREEIRHCVAAVAGVAGDRCGTPRQQFRHVLDRQVAANCASMLAP